MVCANLIALVFEVGGFVSMILGRLRKQLKRWNINVGSRRSSIYIRNEKSTSYPYLAISLRMTTQSDKTFSHKKRQVII